MKISKSKRQLAQLLIEAGVKQFPDAVNWVAQDSDGDIRGHECKPKWQIVNKYWWEGGESWLLCRADRIANFHQTILSRAEFDLIATESVGQGGPDADGWIEWKPGFYGDMPVAADTEVDILMDGTVYHRYVAECWKHWGSTLKYRLYKPEQVEPQHCESVTRAIPEPVTAPTLDQLLQDYRDASDFAAAKQAEADKAAKMRDERWKAAQARACELGVHISVELVVDAEMRESEPVITDWRDLRVGDLIKITGFSGGVQTARRSELLNADSCTVVVADGNEVQVEVTGVRSNRRSGWLLRGVADTQWRFISRP